MADIRQTKEYAKYMEALGWIVEEKKSVFYFIKKIFFTGVLKVQRPETIDVKAIDQIAQEYGVFHVIIEPKNNKQAQNLVKNGYTLSKGPYLPTKTIEIDLTKPKKSLWKNMDKKTRYSIRRGEGNKIKENFSKKEIKQFQKVWRKSIGFKRHATKLDHLLALKKMFNKSTPLFLTSHNNDALIMGGSLFTQSSSKISYYWQNFSNKEGRTSLSSYSLLWYGILWAKSQGCKTMDLEGIYDSRFPNESWKGFSRFKLGFGGKIKKHPGAYTKYRFPYTIRL